MQAQSRSNERADERTTSEGSVLTPMQQGMVFETIGQRRPWTNLQQIVCRLHETIDIPRLTEAWAAAQTVHPVLRSGFVLNDGPMPTQVIEPAAPIPFDQHDWSVLQAEDRETRLSGWLAHDRSRGIDLRRAPCQRLTLFSLAADDDVLVWTFHHALLDGRSFTLVLEDVFDHYDGLNRERPPSPGTRRSFAEHAGAVQDRPQEPEHHYFATLLDGVTGPTVLPTTTERPEVGDGPHHNVERRLATEVTDGLAELATETDTTPYTCLLAAWAILLGRYARSTDVVFGSTRSGRHAIPGMADVAGCFINTVPTRVDVDPDLGLGELLRAIRADQVAVRPFEQAALVGSTAISGLAAGTSLLTTNVVYERYLMSSQLRSRGPSWSNRHFEVLEEGGFPLSLAAYEDDGLRLVIEFDPSYYDSELVAAMLGHLDRLLTEMAGASSDTKIASLDMLQPDERLMLSGQEREARAAARPTDPATRPGTERVTEPAVCYPEVFERAVAANPEAPAVMSASGDDELTYAELDRRVNRLAHLLRSVGVGTEDRVAICLPRSPDYAVALLAVGKVEAAFVPLDPTYPEASLRHMISDSGARIVLTQSSLSARLPDVDGCASIEIDTTPDLADQPDTAPPRPSLRPDHLAYSIYTSGSTGVPKGVLITHRSLASHTSAFLNDYVDLSPDDRVLQFASLSFDTSIEEMTPAWAGGACVVMRSDEMAYSMPEFFDTTRARGITVLNLPTAFWHELIRHMDERSVRLPETVRAVIIGGEKAAANAYRTWTQLAPDISWINSYGPTECTISSTVYRPEPGMKPRLTNEVPIGVPMSNAEAYVVDDRGALVPVGVPGELWVGGNCVGKGYHGLPELTEERFKPDPFRNDEHARIYKTGDLVRWLPSGDLEFFGRIDRQIKLRGFRIEPGQIEAAAERLPGVAQAFVAVRTGQGSDGSLIAWLSPTGTDSIDTAAVLDGLRASLPSHMVPAAIVVVDSFPVTAGGKVDRDALPLPDNSGTGPSLAGVFEAADELDCCVQEIFGEVLGLPTVPLDTSFFDLGGHSLLAIRLLDRIEVRTGARITLPILHRAPTVERLAGVLRRQEYDDPYEYLLPIQPGGNKTPIFGIHVLGVNNEYFVPLAERLGPDHPVYGLTLGRIGTTELRDVKEIATAYAAEIQRTAPTGPIILAAVSLGSVVTLELAKQLTGAGRDVALVALFDARGPGGEPEIAARQRLRLHLRMLLTERQDHLLPRLREQLDLARNRFDFARIRRYQRRNRPLPEALHLLLADHEHSLDQEAYDLEPYFGPVALFRADREVFDDPGWRHDGMGWSAIAQGEFTKIDVPGAHLSILAEPNVAVLARELDRLGREAIAPRADSSSTQTAEH